jgi:sporulation protein YlmC with PRC-barrel domain
MADRQRVWVSELLGRKVFDSSGASVGRIEEIRAVDAEDRCTVREYVTGMRGVFERLSIARLGYTLLRLFGIVESQSGFTIPVHLMDVSDPTRPRLRCTRDELQDGRGITPP